MGNVYQKQSHVATQETVKEDGDRTQIKITEVLGVCSCCLKNFQVDICWLVGRSLQGMQLVLYYGV